MGCGASSLSQAQDFRAGSECKGEPGSGNRGNGSRPEPLAPTQLAAGAANLATAGSTSGGVAARAPPSPTSGPAGVAGIGISPQISIGTHRSLCESGDGGGGDPEQQRLEAFQLLRQSPPSDCFAPITKLLRQLFQVPYAGVSLIGDEGVLNNALTPTEWSYHRRGNMMCEWALKQERPETIAVDDMSVDDRFKHLDCVTGPPHLRFYASHPLVSPKDSRVCYGTLCVLDHQPRTFSASQYQMLAHFARLAVGELERDLEVARSEQALRDAQASLHTLTRGFDASKEAVVVCHTVSDGWPVVYANLAADELIGLAQLPSNVLFWQLFSPTTTSRKQDEQQQQEELQRLVDRGTPFTLSCLPLTCRLPPKVNPQRTQSVPGGASLAGLQQVVPADVLRTSLDGGGGGGGGAADAAASITTLGSIDSGRTAGSPWPSLSSDPGFSGGGGGRRGSSVSSSGTTLSKPASLEAVLAGRRTAASHQALAITFAPCTSLNMRGGGGSGANRRSAASDGDAALAPDGSPPQPYWFATLRSTTAAARMELLSLDDLLNSKKAKGDGGKKKGGVQHMLRPEALAGVTLGSLLGSGAYGRTFRGVWQGSEVAVKVVEMRDAHISSSEEPSPVSTGWTHSGGSGGGVRRTGLGTGSGSGAASGSSNNAPMVEAVLSKSLSHPHIVKTHAYGVREHVEEGQRWKEFWIVQELCTRGTLAKAVTRGLMSNPATRTPRLGVVLRTALEVAAALAYLHSNGVLHGDLNGNNILLNDSTKDSRGFVAMVADFGLSRPLDVLSTLTTGTYGTVSHMPPELIIDGRLTTAADVYSFGVVLWEMLSGRRAWTGMNALQIVSAVTVKGQKLHVDPSWPPLLQDLVSRCLSHDPLERPTAEQLLAGLEDMLAAGLKGLGLGRAASVPVGAATAPVTAPAADVAIGGSGGALLGP